MSKPRHLTEEEWKRSEALRMRVWRRNNREKARESWTKSNKKRQDDPVYKEKNRVKCAEWQARRQNQQASRPKPSICELCSRPGNIVFDHCHTSDLFRGWLCMSCNTALGLVNDDTELLRRMISYLDEARKAETEIRNREEEEW